ncbi:MAG: Hsp20/alpha crystallin family protein, partial [Candidatus Promineifilaceae bacterium]
MMWPSTGTGIDMRRLRWDMDFQLGGTSGPVQSNFPAMNMWAGDERVIVTAEIPGILPENLDITVRGDRLTISGDRNLDELPEGARYNRRERGQGQFSRTLQLQFQVDAENVGATFKNG